MHWKFIFSFFLAVVYIFVMFELRHLIIVQYYLLSQNTCYVLYFNELL